MVQARPTSYSTDAVQTTGQLETQLAWHQLNELYVARVHEGWWDQMPLGQSIARLVQFPHTHMHLTQHLGQLFKIEALPQPQDLPTEVASIGIKGFQDWLQVAQHLGLMMLSVPLSVEIDGKLKLKFVESFGDFGPALVRYAMVEDFQRFYRCTTYKNLRLINDKPAEMLLREASFEAWSLLSLILPKGVTQRVHLTLPPEWVAEIQGLRNRFGASEEVSDEITELMTPISTHLTRHFSDASGSQSS